MKPRSPGRRRTDKPLEMHVQVRWREIVDLVAIWAFGFLVLAVPLMFVWGKFLDRVVARDEAYARAHPWVRAGGYIGPRTLAFTKPVTLRPGHYAIGIIEQGDSYVNSDEIPSGRYRTVDFNRILSALQSIRKNQDIEIRLLRNRRDDESNEEFTGKRP